jgi:hypothetical protein
MMHVFVLTKFPGVLAACGILKERPFYPPNISKQAYIPLKHNVALTVFSFLQECKMMSVATRHKIKW